MLDHLLQFTGMAAAVLEEGEAPDFILDVEGQRVGLEVTEYIRGRSSTGICCFARRRGSQSTRSAATFSKR